MTWWCSGWRFHFTQRSESLFSWHGAFLCGVCGFSPSTQVPAHIPKTIPSLTGRSELFKWVQVVVMLAEELRHVMAYLENSNFVFTEDSREAASVEVLPCHPSTCFCGKPWEERRHPTLSNSPPSILAVTLCALTSFAWDRQFLYILCLFGNMKPRGRAWDSSSCYCSVALQHR